MLGVPEQPVQSPFLSDATRLGAAAGERPIDPRNIEVIDDLTVWAMRRLTGMKRLEIASQMFATAGFTVRGAIRHLHPDWPESSVEQEARRRLFHESA